MVCAFRLWLGHAGVLSASLAAAHAQLPQVTPVAPPQLWRSAEFLVTNVPPATNVFDPDGIRLDAVFTLPSARSIAVPGFWYQGYERSLSGGTERLTPSGAPGWRVRFTPPEPGDYSLVVSVTVSNQLFANSPAASFSVGSNNIPARTGFVRVATGNAYFETGDGQALKLIGENVCWHGGRGTYDYDDWFPALQATGANFARLWMWPYAFGIEVETNSLGRYRLDRAWQLDYVVKLAEQRGIYLLLCLDYHGMFEQEPDAWGGNNFWPKNPYNTVNGGPCLNPNGFFTNRTAQVVYQKRLRYLVARYGSSPNLLAWEFLNEIDNVYRYLVPADVASWHGSMGGWLHTNDPFGHLVTTSLTGSSDRAEIWNLTSLDFAAYHSYNEPRPAVRLAQVAQSFLSRYRKPIMIGEFGMDWRGWNRASDPYLRGFRQGIWGGALGGSVGTGMSWWWENIHSENAYTVYLALGSILGHTGWSSGSWTNIGFQTAGSPPTSVGDLIAEGAPFSLMLSPGTGWGAKPAGQLAVANADSAGYASATLNAFLQGTAHPDLRVPFRLHAWLTNNARLVLHLNSVSSGSILSVRADGVELYRTNLPNLDGGWNVNNEYNVDIPVSLPAGRRMIEVVNAGVDWFFLDWVKLEGVLPSKYHPDWAPSPDAIGLSGPREALVYVVAPNASFPANATNAALPRQTGQQIVLTNWPAGSFLAEWRDPLTATNLATTLGTTTNGILMLRLPPFVEDLAGIIFPQPRLRVAGVDQDHLLLELESETGGAYTLDQSADLTNWTPFLSLTNHRGVSSLRAPLQGPRTFFRARR